ncbi:type II secretion system F family protein [Capsulimonas corticalis]|nr:type II secretion system F family protein [Capsulimonas corticalis]
MRLTASGPAASAAGGAVAMETGSGLRMDTRFMEQSLGPPPVLSPGKWLLTKFVYPVWTGVSLRDMALLYRQLATLTNAGLNLQHTVSTIALQIPNSILRKCLRTMERRISAGEPLSAAMAEYPWIFPDYQRAAVITGEATGSLDIMFGRLADWLEQEHNLRSMIKREMFLPCINLTGMFLLPPLVDLVMGHPELYYEDAILPMLQTIGVIAAIYVMCRLASGFRLAYDAVLSVIPAIGGAVRMLSFARFCRTLASLYAAGVNIIRALQYAVDGCGNTYLGRRIATAIPRIESGEGITQALGMTGIFPPIVLSMLGTGEESGNLDQMMDKMASYYEAEAAVRLHQISVSLGVITTIAVGIRILLIVIKFYTGLYGPLSGIMNDMDK